MLLYIVDKLLFSCRYERLVYTFLHTNGNFVYIMGLLHYLYLNEVLTQKSQQLTKLTGKELLYNVSSGYKHKTCKMQNIHYQKKKKNAIHPL